MYLNAKYFSVSVNLKPYKRFGISGAEACYWIYFVFFTIMIPRRMKPPDYDAFDDLPPGIDILDYCRTEDCRSDVYCEMAIEDNCYESFCYECFIVEVYEYLDEGGSITNVKLQLRKKDIQHETVCKHE